MPFSSIQFIFLFLPVVVLGYFILQQFKLDRFKGGWLLLCSIGFYAFWKYEDLFPLIISASFNYALYKRLCDERYKKQCLIFGILCNLLFLAWFKYPILFLNHQQKDIPLGISFYTFTQIAFLVDGYGQKFKELSFSKYNLFVGYFPHLICGPILLFKDFYPQLLKKSQLKITGENITYFLFFFSAGLFKKLFIADPLGEYVSSIFDKPDILIFNIKSILLGTLCYSFQLYADFSGYSDMAVGLSKLFGITIPFNFNSPYKSTSIVEFWRRWHMSLSNFLRNYIYIPLGGSRMGEVRQSLNLLTVMIIGGLWHGSSITFLIWGAYHGLLLTISHHLKKRFSRSQDSMLITMIKVATTFMCVSFGWTIFRSQNMSQLGDIMYAIVSMKRDGLALRFTNNWQQIALVMGIIMSFILPETQRLHEIIFVSKDERIFQKAVPLLRRVPVAGLVSGVLLALGILCLGKPQQFLYSGF